MLVSEATLKANETETVLSLTYCINAMIAGEVCIWLFFGMLFGKVSLDC